MSAIWTAIDERFSEIEKHLAALEVKPDGDAMARRIDALEKRVDGLDANKANANPAWTAQVEQRLLSLGVARPQLGQEWRPVPPATAGEERCVRCGKTEDNADHSEGMACSHAFIPIAARARMDAIRSRNAALTPVPPAAAGENHQTGKEDRRGSPDKGSGTIAPETPERGREIPLDPTISTPPERNAGERCVYHYGHLAPPCGRLREDSAHVYGTPAYHRFVPPATTGEKETVAERLARLGIKAVSNDREIDSLTGKRMFPEEEPTPPERNAGRRWTLHFGGAYNLCPYTVGNCHCTPERGEPVGTETQEVIDAVYHDAEIKKLEGTISGMKAMYECLEERAAKDRATVVGLCKVIDWALGKGEAFPVRQTGEGAYYWRNELRRKTESVLAAADAKEEK